MLKKGLFYACLLSLTNKLSAQVTATQTFSQYSATAMQPTALPFHYFEQFDPPQTDENADELNLNAQSFKGWHLNLGTRTEWHTQTNPALSGSCTIDRIPNPTKLGFQMGGGVLYSDLETVQITAPFLHASVGTVLTENWRLLGGAGYQRTMQRLNLNRLTYKDLDDPKIALVNALAQKEVNVMSVSAAMVHLKKGYIGMGYKRLFESNQYQGVENKPFSEINLLIEYVFQFKLIQPQNWMSRNRYSSALSEQPRRGFLTNVHVSMAMQYLRNAAGSYPLHAQFNGQVTLTHFLWAGLGWNTANRTQFRVGLLKIPVYKTETAHSEYQFWMAYDLPTTFAPRQGVELHIGYHF